MSVSKASLDGVQRYDSTSRDGLGAGFPDSTLAMAHAVAGVSAADRDAQTQNGTTEDYHEETPPLYQQNEDDAPNYPPAYPAAATQPQLAESSDSNAVSQQHEIRPSIDTARVSLESANRASDTESESGEPQPPSYGHAQSQAEGIPLPAGTENTQVQIVGKQIRLKATNLG